MCILCDHGTLDRLTVPLERLGPGELAEAIRTARDAAGPGVMDHAEAVLRGEAPTRIGGELFAEVVVARALEAGVVSSADAYRWNESLREGGGSSDPRVLAFVSSSAEIVDEYLLLLHERGEVLGRFVESRGQGVEFSWLGQDGELWFEYQDELYCVLTESEALDIAEREMETLLHTLSPELLLRYSSLPDTGLEVIEGILTKPPEVADSLLAGVVDIPALAEDRARAEGYAAFLQAEQARPVEEMRFGEWILARMRAE